MQTQQELPSAIQETCDLVKQAERVSNKLFLEAGLIGFGGTVSLCQSPGFAFFGTGAG